MNTIDLLDPLVVDAIASGIIEQGGNDSAGYIRFANGSQLAWATQQTGAINNAHGSLYISALTSTTTWAAAFAATPVVVVQALSDSGNSPRWAGQGTSYGTSTDTPPMWAVAANSTTNTATLRFIGIGRWK